MLIRAFEQGMDDGDLRVVTTLSGRFDRRPGNVLRRAFRFLWEYVTGAGEVGRGVVDGFLTPFFMGAGITTGIAGVISLIVLVAYWLI